MIREAWVTSHETSSMHQSSILNKKHMQLGMQVVARQSEGHPEVVLREAPTGAILYKILNGTVLTVLEKLDDLFVQAE